jgi:sulfate adenylyltransferase
LQTDRGDRRRWVVRIARAVWPPLAGCRGRTPTYIWAATEIVRKHLSSELGFSKEHRDLNIRCIGFVAAELAKNGGIPLCALIAPYDRVRKEVGALIGPGGGFVLVYAGAGWTTPVSGRVCAGNTA